MSIRKIDDLNFEQEYPVGWGGDTQDLEFTKDGLEIRFEVLTWDDIKTAYRLLFGSELVGRS